jgi:hypothetical protein
MTSIAETLTDLTRRIAESERRVAELSQHNTEEAAILLLSATAVLRELRAFQARLQAVTASVAE